MKPKLNDYFYLIHADDDKEMRKINYLADTGVFEWGKIYKSTCGWADIKELQINPNKKSKVKWILDWRTKK